MINAMILGLPFADVVNDFVFVMFVNLYQSNDAAADDDDGGGGDVNDANAFDDSPVIDFSLKFLAFDAVDTYNPDALSCEAL